MISNRACTWRFVVFVNLRLGPQLCLKFWPFINAIAYPGMKVGDHYFTEETLYPCA